MEDHPEDLEESGCCDKIPVAAKPHLRHNPAMSQIDRLQRIRQLFRDRRSISIQLLLDTLEISRATLKRDLAFLRDVVMVPIVFDREVRAYRLEGPAVQGTGQYELPGLWFSSQEIHALLTMQHLLANLGPGGLLHDHIEPLLSRLNQLLGSADSTAEEIRRRILIVGLGRREYNLEHFERIGSALLRRQRLEIDYYARSNDALTTRQVSPQRLVHYRENWYLDAWCHLRNGLRNFSIDSIRRVETLDRPAREVAERTLSSVLGPGYGIFGGKLLQTAHLRFTPARARWVAAEQWHVRQKGRMRTDGSYELSFPFSDPRELVMDILRFGADVEVLGPETLRAAVRAEAVRLAALYAVS